MPRPQEPCNKCVREGTPCDDHLGNTYDHQALKEYGTTELTSEQRGKLDQWLIVYALNRLLALDRDNGNKAAGVAASRTYQSRNERVSRIMSDKCPERRGVLRCLRNQGHEGEHKF